MSSRVSCSHVLSKLADSSHFGSVEWKGVWGRAAICFTVGEYGTQSKYVAALYSGSCSNQAARMLLTHAAVYASSDARAARTMCRGSGSETATARVNRPRQRCARTLAVAGVAKAA